MADQELMNDKSRWPEGAVKAVALKHATTFVDSKGRWMKRIKDKDVEEGDEIKRPAKQLVPNRHYLTAEDRNKGRANQKHSKPSLPATIDFPLVSIVEELSEKYHLTKNMSHFLAVRLNFSNDADACSAIGLNRNAASSWRWSSPKRTLGPQPQFNDAYQELLDRAKEASQAKLNALRWKTVNRMDELLDAERTVTRTIKTEDGTEQITDREPDHNARFQGIQAVSRWLGEWGTEPRVTQSTQYVTINDQFGRLMQRIVEEKTIEGELVEEDE